jgi:hypothetical protein
VAAVHALGVDAIGPPYALAEGGLRRFQQHMIVIRFSFNPMLPIVRILVEVHDRHDE